MSANDVAGSFSPKFLSGKSIRENFLHSTLIRYTSRPRDFSQYESCKPICFSHSIESQLRKYTFLDLGVMYRIYTGHTKSTPWLSTLESWPFKGHSSSTSDCYHKQYLDPRLSIHRSGLSVKFETLLILHNATR